MRPEAQIRVRLLECTEELRKHDYLPSSLETIVSRSNLIARREELAWVLHGGD